MGRLSTKENKLPYQLSREKLDLSREEATDVLQWIPPERIERIENEKSAPQPEEIWRQVEERLDERVLEVLEKFRELVGRETAEAGGKVTYREIIQNNAAQSFYLYGEEERCRGAVETILQNRKKSAAIIQGDTLVNLVVEAVQTEQYQRLKESFLHKEVLVIYNFHGIAGKFQTQELLYYIVDWYLERNMQLLVTGNEPCSTMPGIEQRNITQMEGLIALDVVR